MKFLEKRDYNSVVECLHDSQEAVGSNPASPTMKEASFTKEEKALWEKVGQVVADFQRLEQTHPSDMQEMVNAVHVLQHILGQRVLRREFPGSFASYKAAPNIGGGVDWVPRKSDDA